MYRFDEGRWLPATIISVAMFVAPFGVAAQSSISQFAHSQARLSEPRSFRFRNPLQKRWETRSWRITVTRPRSKPISKVRR